MKNIIVSLLILFSVVGCKAVPEEMKPMGWVFKQIPEDAPPIFKIAWKHGCSSGLSGMTNSLYRSNYEFIQDPELRKDPEYYKVWKDTFTFCRHYAYGLVRQSDIRMKNPNSFPEWLTSMFGAENIFDHGLLNMTGPGKSSLFLENWGTTGGDSSIETMNGAIDYSGELFNGNPGGLNWDFRPNGTSIAPYHTDSDFYENRNGPHIKTGPY